MGHISATFDYSLSPGVVPVAVSYSWKTRCTPCETIKEKLKAFQNARRKILYIVRITVRYSRIIRIQQFGLNAWIHNRVEWVMQENSKDLKGVYRLKSLKKMWLMDGKKKRDSRNSFFCLTGVCLTSSVSLCSHAETLDSEERRHSNWRHPSVTGYHNVKLSLPNWG